MNMAKVIPVEVSARHCHLSQKDIDKLFGKGYQLKKAWQLTQPSDFAAEEKVDVQSGKNKLSLRVIGPARKETQVELSITDAFRLKIKPVLKISGDLKNTPGITLVGPKGRVRINRGAIIALRHIHCTQKEAKAMGFKNNQKASIRIAGARGLIFNNVIIRTGENYRLCCHIDSDEGNGAGINKKAKGYLL